MQSAPAVFKMIFFGFCMKAAVRGSWCPAWWSCLCRNVDPGRLPLLTHCPQAVYGCFKWLPISCHPQAQWEMRLRHQFSLVYSCNLTDREYCLIALLVLNLNSSAVTAPLIVIKVLKFPFNVCKRKGFLPMITLTIFLWENFSKAPFMTLLIFAGIFVSGHSSNNWKAQTEQWDF